MHHLPSSATPRHRLADAAHRAAIEVVVSAHLGHAWTIVELTDLDELASHPSAIMGDGRLEVFAKLGTGASAVDQFEVEVAGLEHLARLAGTRTPRPIGDGVVPVPGGAILLLEAIRSVPRTDDGWRDIGRLLAGIHRVHGDRFGFPTDGWFGPLHLDHREVPGATWADFYAERRVVPRLTAAVRSGHVPADIAHRVDRLLDRLPDLAGPNVRPTLLHGDAQQNNFITTAGGAVAIDPAVHFGHPEVDLALLDYFAPVPVHVFDGYREVGVIDDGFVDRRDLWRVFAYLAVVEVAGPVYLPGLATALDRYVP